MRKCRTSLFKRIYGKTSKELSIDLDVSKCSILAWHKKGLNIFKVAEKSKVFRKNDKRLAVIWGNMFTRCYSPTTNRFKNYGGKGIKVKMSKFDLVFLWNRDKARLMNKPSIDRKDTAGHYEISNCRFIEWENNNKPRKKL